MIIECAKNALSQYVIIIDCSTRARNDFDDGLYSEQLMLRNLFVNWLLLLEEHDQKKKMGEDIDVGLSD